MKEKINFKILIIRILFTILIISNCILIFIYSNQNAKESTELSRGTMYKIIKIISGQDDLEKAKEYDSLIRKIAHFGIYTSLGIWCNCLLCTFFSKEEEKTRDKKRIIISVLIGFLYACSDEIHQLFSDGRAGRIIDVFLDTLGVVNGVLLVILIIKIIKIHQKNNYKN